MRCNKSLSVHSTLSLQLFHFFGNFFLFYYLEVKQMLSVRGSFERTNARRLLWGGDGRTPLLLVVRRFFQLTCNSSLLSPTRREFQIFFGSVDSLYTRTHMPLEDTDPSNLLLPHTFNWKACFFSQLYNYFVILNLCSSDNKTNNENL